MIPQFWQALSALLACFACMCCSLTGTYSIGQETAKTGAEPAEVTLQVGDKAPMICVDKWLNGEAVESFSAGRVYVVEFWATWCAPCIKSMPHLSVLSERYAKDGLVVIALTTTDDANTMEAVERFVGGPGEEYRFQYAICESDLTYKSYMEASGQAGIPCSFIIDGDGNLAYIGHPHDLDYVLERVISGNWSGKVDADAMREMNESIAQLGAIVQSDPDRALEIIEYVRKENPGRAKGIDFAYSEVMVLCKKEMFDRAKDVIESLAIGAGESVDWGTVAVMCSVLASNDLNPEGRHREFAAAKIKAAEEALKDDWQNLLQVGVAYQQLGDVGKFKECMERVIELCPDEQISKSLRSVVNGKP